MAGVEKITENSMDKAKKDLGDLLNTLRRTLELTQEDVADQIGCSLSFYSAMEVGRKPVPPELLHKLIMKLKPGKDDYRKINKLAARLQKEIRIRTNELDDERAEMVMLLARKIPELDKPDLTRLRAVLEPKV